MEVKVPDIGDFKDVPVIEVLIGPGDRVKQEDSLVTLESDKATMEVPSPASGVVKEVKVKVGDRVSEGVPVVVLEAADGDGAAEQPQAVEKADDRKSVVAPVASPPPETEPEAAVLAQPAPPRAAHAAPASSAGAHASPAVRRLAREFGVDLARVKGTGPKERILKEDVQSFVKGELARPRGAESTGFGPHLPPLPVIDFAKFGPVETQPLSRIRKLSG
ncbi:MAG TPA: biotin/lipoyl-containing protein, partial [Burkholderiales bacterium]|nr:biotin/lipoyl-containing protein [Burkholderiales bacterium]